MRPAAAAVADRGNVPMTTTPILTSSSAPCWAAKTAVQPVHATALTGSSAVARKESFFWLCVKRSLVSNHGKVDSRGKSAQYTDLLHPSTEHFTGLL